MGKKSKKKNKIRGVDAPRPLGWTGEEKHYSEDFLSHMENLGKCTYEDALESFRVEALGLDSNDWKDAPLRMDMLLQSHCDEEYADFSSGVPVLSVNHLRKCLYRTEKRSNAILPISVESVWICCRNDFSGEGLRLLLRSGGLRCINEVHELNGSTPLSILCSRGNLAGLKVLLDETEAANVKLDARKGARNHDSMNAADEPLFRLLFARGNNHALGSVKDFSKMIELLCTRCKEVDLDSVRIDDGPPVGGLAFAVEMGEKLVVETCIRLGANPNFPSPHNKGMTPLHMACKAGSETLTRMLLDAGADTRLAKPENGTFVLPITYTLNSMNMAVADIILRHEEELEAKGELRPVSLETELRSNLSLIRHQVEIFRKTGKPTLHNVHVVDRRTRTTKTDLEYENQVKERVDKKAGKTFEKCDGCGDFGASLKKCSACGTAAYCGRNCQKAHWKLHKQVCKAVQATNASTD
jgi:hypothetical protein